MKTKTKPTSAASGALQTSRDAASRAEIADRAYTLWVQEGRPENRELDHWLAAERELGGDSVLHDSATRLTAHANDPASSDASELESELDQMVGSPARRSATAL